MADYRIFILNLSIQHEHILGSGSRGHAPSVNSHKFGRRRPIEQYETAPANPTHKRLDRTQRKRGRYGCVYGVPTLS
jgi:hypothetical protein